MEHPVAQTSAKFPSADRAMALPAATVLRRSTQTQQYPLQIWYLLASFIVLISICHFTTLLVARVRAPKSFSTGGRGPSALGPTDQKGNRFAVKHYANRAGFIAVTQFPLLIALGMSPTICTSQSSRESVTTSSIFYTALSRTHYALCFGGTCRWSRQSFHLLQYTFCAYRPSRPVTPKRPSAEQGVRRGDVVPLWIHGGLCPDAAVCPIRAARSQARLPDVHGRALLRRNVSGRFLVQERTNTDRMVHTRILLVGAFVHTQKPQCSNNASIVRQTHFIWPSFVIWGFDRALRLVRIFVVNGGYLNLLGKKDAQATPLVANVDVAYLSVPSVSKTPWEAHPFSIANIDSDAPIGKGLGSESWDSSGASSRDEKLESGEDGSTLVLPTPVDTARSSCSSSACGAALRSGCSTPLPTTPGPNMLRYIFTRRIRS
ncbi:hypothetical protein B0H13DRAFT_1897101 [Mycena leptocephala]|nr:hypothetical protein B0H13DRAFT_1897101 [Mycena leptocephala]